MRVVTFLVLLAFAIVYAIRRGGGPERAVALTLLAIALSDPLVHSFTPAQFRSVDPGHLIIDTIAWVVFLFVAITAKRFWPLCVSACQSIALIAHIVRMLDFRMNPYAYGIMQFASSWLLVLALIVGTSRHRKRVMMQGPYPSWNNLLPRSRQNRPEDMPRR